MTNIKKPLKIILLGDSGTGKTNLLSRVTTNHFNPTYEPTSGINEVTHDIQIGDQKVAAEIWELGGGEKYRDLADSLLRDANGIFLVYDISSPATFENLTMWLMYIRLYAPSKVVIKLVGNKADLQGVPTIKAFQFASNNDLSSIETSGLNDINVQLAFETIAQEIDVAMNFAAESPSADQNNSKAFSDLPLEPFHVVLIDIEEAASEKVIVCVAKPLGDANLEFIALSYRWGEVDEQVVHTKLGYVASITSFHLDDFYNLCDYMRRDPDLKSIKYVWVDAICVDQNNLAQRKATIYQMSNIYYCAAYILAVPDLHLKYLRNSRSEIKETFEIAEDQKEFFYYLIHGKLNDLDKMTEEWFDEMDIPKNVMARERLTSMELGFFMDCFKVFKFHNDGSNGDCQHNHSDIMEACHDIPADMYDYVQYAINTCHKHSENNSKVYENNDCALCSLQVHICKYQENNLNENEAVPDGQKWVACVLKELQFDAYKKLVDKRKQDIGQVVNFLQTLVKDWSSRVWVISEYEIAKSKPSHQLKYWFLSFGDYISNFEKLGFFVFDFNIKVAETPYHGPMTWMTAEVIKKYTSFHDTLKQQLNEKSFVEKMLKSKSSRNEDRFYAIFPSSEYADKLTSREVVSSWLIDNIVSVKLKLYELMATNDKLELLLLTTQDPLKSTSTFPTFVTSEIDWEYKPLVKKCDVANFPCNFDLDDDATLRLVPFLLENGAESYKLNLLPNMFYTCHSKKKNEERGLFRWLFNKYRTLWETLEVNFAEDQFMLVRIPLYITNKDYADRKDIFIDLFGNVKKKKWLVVNRLFDWGQVDFGTNSSDLHLYSKTHYNHEKITSFDIY